MRMRMSQLTRGMKVYPAYRIWSGMAGALLVSAAICAYAQQQPTRADLQGACSGDLNAVKEQVDHGMDKHTRGQALLCAARNGDLEIVKYLVEHGADIN